METFNTSVVQFGPLHPMRKSPFVSLMDSSQEALSPAAFSAKISVQYIGLPTKPRCTSFGPSITQQPRAHVAQSEERFCLKQQPITSCSPGAYKNATLPLSRSATIGSEAEIGETHPPEINIQPAESLSIGHMFDINQEFFHMIKTGQGYLWRGWKGKFTPPNRGDNAVKPSGSAFGQIVSPDGKEIYSWCKLHCCRRYFESCTKQEGSHEVETPLQEEDGLEWWEIGGDGSETGFSGSSDDSESSSEEESDDCEEESDDSEEESDDSYEESDDSDEE
ncbi:hypothetical protein HOY82DRAFT_631239 [Tuber indicum]|nr:hypothetical protein HOY82DRAFT_631239 [Tuber indicum]